MILARTRAALLRWMCSTGVTYKVRGMWRVSRGLARGLTSYPVSIQGETLYVDLESLHGHAIQLLTDPEQYEPAEQGLLRKLIRPGDTIYDIGANVGIYSVLFAGLVGPAGKVVSFEPNPALIANLRRSAEGIGHMRFYPCALAEAPGEMVFYVPEDHQMASLRNWSSQPSARTQCAVKTLNDLAPELPAPQLIKMDVEGAELLVLKGSGRFWESLAEPPMVLFEQIPMAAEAFGYAAIEAQRWLRDRGLRIFRIHSDGSLSDTGDQVYPDPANMLAVPPAQLARLRSLGIVRG